MAARKVVLCGAGFVGKHIARTIVSNNGVPRQVQVSSRNPSALYETLRKCDVPADRLTAVPVDITKPDTLAPAFEGAHAVVSLVGILHGTPAEFEKIQCRGAENVAKAAKEAGAKLIHMSAIGADPTSELAYARTKGQAEQLVRSICPDATIIRPSIVFGPEDNFFNRFARLSKFLPFLPIFNGGTTRFQPVYVGNIAQAVEIMTRGDPEIEKEISGKIIEAGGPQVFTFRQLMVFVLKYAPRNRMVVSLPLSVGMLQASIMERLPPNLFTITRDQVKQLQIDNIINPHPGPDHLNFETFVWKHSNQLPTSLHYIVPGYLQ